MRHRVVLYNPEAVFYTLPLGLLAVGSALDPEEYEVQIIDGRLEPDPVGAVLAALEGAVCLGISVLTGDPIRDALRVSRAAKARYPGAPVVWGGWHPSLFPRECLAEPAVDVAVTGQGEETFREIVARLSTGRTLDGVLGCAHRQNGQVVVEAPRPLQDVNRLPAHNFNLIPVERYYVLKGKKQMDYISSTGCRFRCSFCADPYVYKRGWTGLAPERVGEEIEQLWQRYRFEELAFQDETFFTRRDRVEAIAEEFIRRRLPIAWTGTLRADQGVRLDHPTLEKCKRSGLRRVMIGVESGSQQMLDWMQKDIRVEQILASAEKCARLGIGAIFPFIVGFPDEPDESLVESMKLIKRLRAMSPDFEVAIFYYKPYPGNPIADYAVARGYQMPCTLEDWARFDFIGSSGPWVSAQKAELVERFKFYQRFAYGHNQNPLRWPLHLAARWRVHTDRYGLPIEKILVEKFRPGQRLS